MLNFSKPFRAAAALLSCKASLLGMWCSHSRQQLRAAAATNGGSPSARKAAAAAGQGVHNNNQWPMASSTDGGSASSAEESNVSSTSPSGSHTASDEGQNGLGSDPGSSRAGHRQAASGAHGSTASSEGTRSSQADVSGSSRGDGHVLDEEPTCEEAAASQEDPLLTGSEAAEPGSDAGQDSDVSMADAEAADAAAVVGAADPEGVLAEPGSPDMADPVLQGLLYDVQLACRLLKLALSGQRADGSSLRCVAVQLHVMWCMFAEIKTLNTGIASP